MSCKCNLSLLLRNSIPIMPVSVGKVLSYVPFEIRPGIGSRYRNVKREIACFEKFDNEQRKMWIVNKITDLVAYSIHNIGFYRELYSKRKFNLNSLKNYDDIKRIPIINKKLLQEYDIEYRSSHAPGRYIVNTGGSSGSPLSFYIQAKQMAVEWAHMHCIWKKLGYTPKMLKLAFGGISNVQDVRYDLIRHSLLANIYADFKMISQKVKKLGTRYPICYLHGYPSALYEFALYCRDIDHEMRTILKHSLKGAFLGSEFPVPLYRETIEEVFCIPTVSWYGHTERCILSYEKNDKYAFVPFQTYGYSEAVTIDTSKPNLVGTSYYNFASPLIRYDTEDHMSEVNIDDGILTEFKINDGRSGEFIVDRNGKKIALTGLIFGRHHELFNYSNHIQVYQDCLGKATILYVPNNDDVIINAPACFDTGNVDIDFGFIALKEPVRTKIGKIRLLVKSVDLDDKLVKK